MEQTVWLLYLREEYGAPWLLGVFSSVEAGTRWLRKSARFMDEPVGPIVPTHEGARVRLTPRHYLDPSGVDPAPLAEYDMSPRAAGRAGER